MRQLFLMFFFMAPGAVVRLARGPNPLFQEQHEEPRRLTLEEFERQQAWATLGASLSLSLSLCLSVSLSLALSPQVRQCVVECLRPVVEGSMVCSA